MVTNVELFFDLVFVFAVTQLSHRLLDHLNILGALETLVLFCAIWWLWIYTSWATNWLDPERGAVRFMLMAMMLGALIMSATLPDAFAGGGAIFALAYAAMQIVRTLIIAYAARGIDVARSRNFLRIAFYFALSLPLWIAGTFAEADVRLPIWAVAVLIEYSGPFLFFRTPGLGRSTAKDWDISGSHMAERCALFIIIALGEAILVTGTTYAGLKHDAVTTTAFVAGFTGSVAMWWIYFDTGEKRGAKAMEETDDTGRLARSAYTYLHMPIVAGIVVTAVGDELMLAHPVGHVDLSFVLVTCGGPALFLLGNMAFKWTTTGTRFPPLSHFAGLILLTVIGAIGLARDGSPVAIGIASTAALVVTAGWEWLSLNGGWQRWTPWIGRRAAIALEEGER